MKLSKARTIMDSVPAARDDLAQIRDDVARAVDVFTVFVLVVSAVVILSALRET